MHIQSARLAFKLVVKCCDCGAETLSETKRVELFGQSIESLAENLRREHVDTSHPVGWASYDGPKGMHYRCPNCVI